MQKFFQPATMLAALESELEIREKSWSEIAQAQGFSPDVIAQLQRNQEPASSEILSICRWLGVPEYFFYEYDAEAVKRHQAEMGALDSFLGMIPKG